MQSIRVCVCNYRCTVQYLVALAFVEDERQ